MPNSTEGFCSFVEGADVALKGDHLHYIVRSGRGEMEVCLSRYEARKMAELTIVLLDSAEDATVIPFGRTG